MIILLKEQSVFNRLCTLIHTGPDDLPFLRKPITLAWIHTCCGNFVPAAGAKNAENNKGTMQCF